MLLSFSVVIVALELVLKFSSIVSTSSITQAVDPTSPIIHFKPNHEFVYSRGWNAQLKVTHQTNNYGFNTSINFQSPSEQSTTPYALIGDSYVEALHVSHSDSTGGILNSETKTTVYPIGISGSALAQYLAFANFSYKQLGTEKLIFIIIENDFDESLLEYKAAPAYHYFDESNNMKLVLVSWQPSSIMRILQTSSLMQYLINNLQVTSLLNKPALPVSENQVQSDKAKIESSVKAVDLFLSSLMDIGIAPKDVLFVVDGDRHSIYKGTGRDTSTYRGHMMDYFIQAASASDFETIDLQEPFTEHYGKENQLFNFSFDYHWNELGHRVASDAIIKSGFIDN